MHTGAADIRKNSSGPADVTGKMTNIIDLRTNGHINPLGIDTAIPVFDWKMRSGRIGARQLSYRIVVRDAKNTIVWDSGEVESGISVDIPYEGEALIPQTIYHWNVIVKDENGEIWSSDENTFETGLMDTSLNAWSGARWIGADEYPLDAAGAAVFDLSMTMHLNAENPKAGIVLGGSDFRLKNRAYNIWGSETDRSYVCIELDATDAIHPVLNLYMAGMPAAVQDLVTETGTVRKPVTDLKMQTAEHEPKPPDFSCELSAYLTADEVYKPVTIRVETAEYGTSNLHIQINGRDVLPKGYVTLNPLGGDICYNSFPNLNQIGFSVPAGSSVVFTDVQVKNPGKYSDGVLLFGKDSGAGYGIFKGLSGVAVDGDTITAGGDEAVLACADPSYGSMPIVRTGFTLDECREIASARLYVSAQGLYEMYVNGRKVTDTWFNPGNEEYRARMPYQTYDVTGLLHHGENAVGAQLAEGWWTGQTSYYAYNYNFYGSREALLAKLDVMYSDGTKETIVTDPKTWQSTIHGPVRYASLYHGQRYDAEREKAVSGWSEAAAELNPEIWKSAAEIPQTRKYEMITRDDRPARVVKIRRAAKALGESLEGSGTWIYDMGENVIGVPHIEISAEYMEPGQTVTLRYAEILYPELDEYIEKGIQGTIWTARRWSSAICSCR